MFARLTLRGFAHKEGLAFVACPAHPLHGYLASQLLPGGAGWHRERNKIRALPLGFGRDGNISGCRPFTFAILGFLLRKPWAFLATRVLALVADFLRTKGGGAAMTGTVYTQANLFLNSFGIASDRWCPLTRFQLQAILGE